MNSYCRYFLLFLLVVAGGLAIAQKQADLEKQRDELNEKIALTKKLIKESESKQQATSSQLAVLNEQIAYREALLGNISQEIRGIEGEIRRKEAAIAELQQKLQDMKDEYAQMIYIAYRNRSSYDKLMYIFAAEDFNQAYKRFKMTQRYAEVRKDQVSAIEKTQVEIADNIALLEKDRTQKQQLAENQEKEKTAIAADKKEQQAKLSALRSEEKKLRDQQKKQEADRKKLTARIEEIIQAELAAERKRAEEERKRNAASGAPANTAPSGASTLAPEVLSMNADFEKNKGGLPWPVNSGVITSRFGRQPHPSIAGIEVDNKGIDFVTEKNGSAIAVFGGTVTSVFAIPGAGQNVIVTHGTYKTVYSGLTDLTVKVGDKVSAKQRIGTVMSNGEDHLLHFEVWKVSSESGAAQNPELWLRKR